MAVAIENRYNVAAGLPEKHSAWVLQAYRTKEAASVWD